MIIKTTQKVYNPDFIKDFQYFINPKIEDKDLIKLLDSIKEKSPTKYEKFETLVDRIEFISHLNLTKYQAKESNYIFQGREVKGINWDIDALNLYLALTCVDIFAKSVFINFSDWLLKNSGEKKLINDLPKYIEDKKKEYDNEFRLSFNFIKAFKESSEGLRTQLLDNLELSNLKNSNPDRKIEGIAHFLYKVRNNYTHEGRRFHSSVIPITRVQKFNIRANDELTIRKGFDLTEFILCIAKEQAIRKLTNIQ